MAGVASRILTFLTDLEAGQAFGIGELRELGLTDAQASTGMYRIIKNEQWPVEVISRGRLWRNAATATGEVETDDDGSAVAFDVVERTSDKVMLMADADGYLWLAKRIGVAE